MTDQNRTGLDWEDVRVFLALARHGSLSGAARVLSVNHATIARRLRSLETAIGEKIVERRPAGYVLTSAGTRLLGPATEMETAAAILARGGADETPKGLVRLNAPPSLAQAFLVERLAGLSAKYPGLDIIVATDVRSVSLERHETDIALRYGRPQDGDVLGRQLLTFGFGFYATPEWQARVAAGESPVFVGFDEMNAHLPEAIWLSRHFPRARMSFRTSNHLGHAAAARSNAGIAYIPHFIGRTDQALHPLRLDHQPPSRELWLITRRSDRKDLSIATVTDFLVRLFADERARFKDGSKPA